MAEPSRHWHSSLRSNRSCSIDIRCVWKATGLQLPFHEAQDRFLSNPVDPTSAVATTYEVETVTLFDLLNCHSSPPHIDYLSVDTEGSELDILLKFAEDKGFNHYRFSVITIEHNFDPPRRQAILAMLSKNGYQRIHEEFSDFDDWYVSR